LLAARFALCLVAAGSRLDRARADADDPTAAVAAAVKMNPELDITWPWQPPLPEVEAVAV